MAFSGQKTLCFLALLAACCQLCSADGAWIYPKWDQEQDPTKYFNFVKDKAKIRRDFGELLAKADPTKISAECKKDWDVIDKGSKNLLNNTAWLWPIQNSQGSFPEPGTLLGRADATGSYEQCLNLEPTYDYVYDENWQKVGQYDFKMNYCKTRYFTKDNLVGVSEGWCVPASCNRNDVYELMEDRPFTMKYSYCGTKLPLSQNTGGIVALVIVGIFLAIVALATLFDTFYRHWEEVQKADTKSATIQKETTLSTIAPASDQKDLGQVNGGFDGKENKLDLEAAPQKSLNGHVENGVAPNGHASTASFQLEEKTKKSQPSAPVRALLAFSLWRTLPSVLSTRSRGFNCMNGVRFLTMTWIILGHTWQLELYVLNDPRTMLAANYYGQFSVMGRFMHAIINNMNLAVEVFFFLSATLVTLSFLKTLTYLKTQFQESRSTGAASSAKELALYVFHRYWRLTPLYAALIMILANLWMYLGYGPLWPEWNAQLDNCRSSWWTNLLYINNLVKTDELCMGWSWYLANDFQFYLIIPMFATALFLSPIGGSILLFLGWGGSVAARIVAFSKNQNDFQFNEVYSKPWCRFGPYAIGIAMGYIIYRTKCKVKMNKIVVAIMWVLAFALGMLVIFGTYKKGGCSDCFEWNKAMNIAYSSLKREAFTLDFSGLPDMTDEYIDFSVYALAGIAWMVFACCAGYGGLINSFLSWGLWIPLSKLTYAGYLVHPVIHFVSLASRMQPMYVQDITMVFQYLGNLMLTIVVSLGLTLVFEVPFLALEKVILPERKKK